MNVPIYNRAGKVIGETLIDEADSWVAQWRWFIVAGYAGRSETREKKREYLYLHRVLMNPDPKMLVDHINGKELDNRRSNLRLVTKSGNMQNRRGLQTNNRSGFPGVCFDTARGRWLGFVRINKRVQFWQHFTTREEAAQAVAAERLRLGFLTGAWGSRSQSGYTSGQCSIS